MLVEITDSATNRINDLCQQNANNVVRLSITSGGCQGFNKVWEIDQVVLDDDIIFVCNVGRLAIDPISLELLNGAIIDYTVNLSGSYFTVTVPSATSTCGCGTSFSI